ncbi:hypothetical protein [Singulisphaera sp. PoT]|uniref:DUF7919 family protein n=1 Tax=Singulisphaera sp. PoT TaxID=3411797 RepID=UPI003BF49CCA
MAYFADLTPYTYNYGTEIMLNVGWLGPGHPLPRGPVSMAFAHELEILAQSPVNRTRGQHICPFCKPPLDVIEMDPKYRDVWEMFRACNTEIHVRGESGVIYCAPTLIVHYVTEHQYQPPAEYIAAVIFHRKSRPLIITPSDDQADPSLSSERTTID